MKKNYNKDRSLKSIVIIIIVLLLSLTFVSICFNIITNNLPNDSISSNEDSSNDENSSNNENYKDGKLIKQLYCQYDSLINYESARGGLQIFIPSNVGYINWNFVHSVSNGSNLDLWRLSKVYSYDDDLKNEEQLTWNAEWEMAITLEGRPDFIGGNAHGDERFVNLEVLIDGVSINLETIDELTSFQELKIIEHSIGYDPNSNETAVLNHSKEYIINKDGILLNQKVEWLGSYALGACYMAMMPPLISLTDMYYTNINYTPKAISTWTRVDDCTSATLYSSQENYRFTMSIPKYVTYETGDYFMITDNGGGMYNKMYFVICQSGNVESGDIWETTTVYNIVNG